MACFRCADDPDPDTGAALARLQTAVDSVYACTNVLHRFTGVSITFPKLHALRHVVDDYILHGRSSNYFLGVWMLTSIPVLPVVNTIGLTGCALQTTWNSFIALQSCSPIAVPEGEIG